VQRCVVIVLTDDQLASLGLGNRVEIDLRVKADSVLLCPPKSAHLSLSPPTTALAAYADCNLCGGRGVVEQQLIDDKPEVIQCSHCRARAKAEARR